MFRIFTPARLLIVGLVLFAAAAFLYIVPSDEYILLPDRARPLAPFVSVKGEKPDGDPGGIYYVAVEVKKASILEKLFPSIREGSTLVPASLILGPKQSETQHRRQELQAMSLSQQVGAAVALKALGYPVKADSPGTVIEAVDPKGPSAGKLRPQDVVVTVDGKRTPSLIDLRRAIRSHRPGEAVRVSVRRGGKVEQVEIKTVPDPQDPKRPIIGVLSSCASQTFTRIDLPIPVHIDLGQVGGPSAGLAFGLDVVEELGHDIDRGNKVAATGEMCVDGTVAPVGGLKQKTIGARRAGADVFLVPAGENTSEAKRYAGSMRVIPVNSFRQALRALATLPRKQPNS
ncbi:MAG: PDZ domain-containing protein [Actinomycetota bacterium]